MHADVIFKIVPVDLWRIAESEGRFTGSPVDVRDGFIHFSTAAQVRETAARHFAGAEGLLLVAVSAPALSLRWEPSRGGALFPHLYEPLPLSAVLWTAPLLVGPDGIHRFPAAVFSPGETEVRNAHGQRIGAPLLGWVAPLAPVREVISGRLCELHPVSPAQTDALFDAFALDQDDREWTYLPYGPFVDRAALGAWVEERAAANDPLLFTVRSGETRIPTGVAGYLRIMPASGSIEVGHLRFSRLLQRTPSATEAMYLMMRHAFELGYRRYEWKCDVFNEPSRKAALRLGFSFEGIFRHATVYKGRTRDTAWYSVIDNEWPALRDVFESWLSPANFDEQGRQKTRLSQLMSARTR